MSFFKTRIMVFAIVVGMVAAPAYTMDESEQKIRADQEQVSVAAAAQEPISLGQPVAAESPELPVAVERLDDIVDDCGNTALILVTAANDTEKALRLISSGANVNAQSFDGTTALHYAAIKGNVPLVKALLQAGAHVRTRDNKENNALGLAVANRRGDIVELLLEHDPDQNVNLFCSEGASPLVGAMTKVLADDAQDSMHRLLTNKEQREGGVFEIVESLLAHRANIYMDISPGSGYLMPHLLGLLCDGELKQLLQRAEAALPQDSEMMMKAIACVEGGFLAQFQKLIDNGFNINQKSGEQGATLLMRASLGGKGKVVKYLLTRGAKEHINDVDSQGNSALHRAAMKGKEGIATLLLDNGASIDQRSNSGATPLFFAVYEFNPAIARLLVDRGAAIDVPLYDSMKTPFLEAVCKNQADMVRYFMEHRNLSYGERCKGVNVARLKGFKPIADLLTCTNKKCGVVPKANQQCARCKATVSYCSKECQVADWPTHKTECSGMLALAQMQADAEAKKAAVEAEKAAKAAEIAQKVADARQARQVAAAAAAAKIPQGSQVLVGHPSEVDNGVGAQVVRHDKVGKAPKGRPQGPGGARGQGNWDGEQQQGGGKINKPNKGGNKGAKQKGAHAKTNQSHGGKSASGPVCAPQGPLTAAEKNIARAHQQLHTLPQPDHLPHSYLQELNAAKDRQDARRKQEERDKKALRDREAQRAQEQEQAGSGEQEVPVEQAFAAAQPEFVVHEQQFMELGLHGNDVVKLDLDHLFGRKRAGGTVTEEVEVGHHDAGAKKEKQLGDGDARFKRLENNRFTGRDNNGCYMLGEKTMFPSEWSEDELLSRLRRGYETSVEFFEQSGRDTCFYGVMRPIAGREEYFEPVHFKGVRKDCRSQGDGCYVVRTIHGITGEEFNNRHTDWRDEQALKATIHTSLLEAAIGAE